MDKVVAGCVQVAVIVVMLLFASKVENDCEFVVEVVKSWYFDFY